MIFCISGAQKKGFLLLSKKKINMSLSKIFRSRSRNRRRRQPPVDVIEKLKRSYGTQTQSQRQLETEAEQLTNVETVKVIHLNSLLATSQQAAEKWENEHSLERTFESSRAYKRAAVRVERHFTDIARLEVKLYLTDIDIFGRAIVGRLAGLMDITYGPLHAALKVGDVFLEWDASSLVIPLSIDPSCYEIPRGESLRFAGQIHQHGTLYKSAQEHRETMKETIPRDHKKMNFTRQLDVVHDLGDHRERIINKLAEVIADYNSNKEYDTLQCNCQHFVEDCLTALEIDSSDRPQFPHAMQKQLTRIKRGKTISPKLGRRRFHSHSELDQYFIDKDKTHMGKDDLEYMSLLFFKFHLRAIKAAGKPEYWKCPEPTCQLDAVQEELLELQEQADELRILSGNDVLVASTSV